MEKKQIGVGVVGTGFMCRSHANAYHKIRWQFWDEPFAPRLIGVGATSQEKAEEARARYGFDYGAVGWDRLLADGEIRLIDVSVGDRLHKRVSMEAIAAGKDVLCEKPLALSVEDAFEMARAAREKGVVAMCGFNYRFFPAVQLLKRLIDRGDLGALYSFNGSYCQDQGADDRVMAEKLWYVQGPKASGASNGIGSHLVDMSRHLMGEVGAVSGRLRTYNKIRQSAAGPVPVLTDEEMVATVDFVSGAAGIYRAAVIAMGRKNCFTFEVNGSAGSAAFDTEEPNILRVCLRDPPVRELQGFAAVNVTQLDRDHPNMAHFWPRGSGLGWEDAHVCEIAHLLRCVHGRRAVAPEGADFSDGARVVQVLDAIRRADREGRRVYLDGA